MQRAKYPAVTTKAHFLVCVKETRGSLIMASFLVGRAKHLTPIFLFKGRVLVETLLSSVNKRYMSQEKPISRFPVPIMDTLPKDIQERMREVQEKVRRKKSSLDTLILLIDKDFIGD